MSTIDLITPGLHNRRRIYTLSDSGFLRISKFENQTFYYPGLYGEDFDVRKNLERTNLDSRQRTGNRTQELSCVWFSTQFLTPAKLLLKDYNLKVHEFRHNVYGRL